MCGIVRLSCVRLSCSSMAVRVHYTYSASGMCLVCTTRLCVLCVAFTTLAVEMVRGSVVRGSVVRGSVPFVYYSWNPFI